MCSFEPHHCDVHTTHLSGGCSRARKRLPLVPCARKETREECRVFYWVRKSGVRMKADQMWKGLLTASCHRLQIELFKYPTGASFVYYRIALIHGYLRD